ncbi:MAG: hypothetical protein AVDCRST_MAG58-3094 [uncultured Rubrobacteraceae bacterium]|uniref:Lipoprotein n=1 Tax=uncultured Rubrobacteraceae bacterium TaxID=349277 RepID=A0A6J4RAT5_9ACTN|nr:MAG: hypothetical protein AVDCRST_MAG58-3094 [uncultured Rubrobacteraceae bacterium]
MRNLHFAAAFSSLLVVLSAVACTGARSGSGTDEASDQNHSGHLSTVSAKDFDRTNFDNSTRVDNLWFPLEPGAHSVFEGSAIDDGERITRRVVTTVTDLTKEINGVNSILVWERDYNEGELVESELGFFAQDKDGNVWHMGEYPEEYEEGEFDKAPGWLAGSKGATAGIAMRAEPRPGTPGYAQGYAPPPINWIDRGRVYKVGQKTCVPVDCYEDVLVIEEFERNKPGAYQLKYYAPGVGDIRVGWRGPEEEEKEGLDLVKDERLGPEALGKARADALKLEKRAYEIKDYYGKTQPAKPTL